MREIRFRAWDKKRKLMAKVFVMDLGNMSARLDDTIIRPEDNGRCGFQDINDAIELMQYTGLKDKNGKEIYEGDIVKSDDKYYPINPVIYYANIVNEHDGDYDEWYCGFCLDDVDHTPLDEEVEVIGNIYENKELLNEKD